VIYLCSTCGCKDAESFEAEIPKDYRIYNPIGSGAGGFKIVSANFINDEDVVIEAELVEGEELFGVPNEFFKGVLSKVYDEYDAESFEGESPMMKNITAIGVLALAIIIGKKIKR
jgi:hypothetical protein